mmetsp:Transcript_1111/g.1559  ORF Transcript_1111/g.1559 Transcript_1111/m.1559 type:complete len:331 (-) Transcript_1111:187-1179(-)
MLEHRFTFLFLIWSQFLGGNALLAPSWPTNKQLHSPPSLVARHLAAPADSDFERPVATSDRMVNADVYNIPLEKAGELWTASVQESNSATREAGMPFLDSKSKDYFVDDIENVRVSREGGMGMELLELAGGRDDGFGITIVTAVAPGSNAEKAGIIPGDSIASIAVTKSSVVGDNSIEESTQVRGCECLDFDNTMSVLANFPGDASEVYMNLKRIRRWPKVQVRVEYPPSQCAEGVSNVREIELFAGENLRRALLNRGIVMDDPEAPKCDFCGGKCTVSVSRGMGLLNPIGTTEEKLMKRNPKCRLSCKTTVGYNMQEGELNLRVNLRQW